MKYSFSIESTSREILHTVMVIENVTIQREMSLMSKSANLTENFEYLKHFLDVLDSMIIFRSTEETTVSKAGTSHLRREGAFRKKSENGNGKDRNKQKLL